MNKNYFISRVKAYLFGGRISEKQISGILFLLDFAEKFYPRVSDVQLAYVLATIKHETAHTMQPVKEYGGTAYFHKMYDPQGGRPKVAANLGNTKPGDGARYCGRGYVQITGRANYRKFGIEANPEKALERETAARIAFDGMIAGTFTGRKLSDYFGPGYQKYTSARAIINGTDKAGLIAGYAQAFADALSQAREKPAPPANAPAKPEVQAPELAQAAPNPEPAKAPIPDTDPMEQATGKPLSQSTTAGAAAAGGVAGAAGPAVEAIKQAQEAAEAGKGLWDIVLAVGPWVALVVVIAAAAGYIIWERRRRAREEGV